VTPLTPLGAEGCLRNEGRRDAGASRTVLGDMRPRYRISVLLLGFGLAATASREVTAQSLERDRGAHRQFLALNVAIGATASVARAIVSGVPVRTALVKGLVGGSLMSTGLELIGTESPSTRFAGLQLTAVGASIARNVDGGAPLLSDLTLPVYPFYLRIRPGTRTPVTARLSAMSAVRLATVMTDGSHTHVDWGASLTTGAPVFRSSRWRLPSAGCPPPCAGAFAQHNAGTIVYSASAGTDYDLRRTLAHESVHLAQQTRDAVLTGIPLSDAGLTRMGGPGRALSRFVVIDVLMPLRLVDEGEAWMRRALRRNSWYETEARAFAPGGELR
jgi:hypothetical protein